jgi:hypothetical protein
MDLEDEKATLRKANDEIDAAAVRIDRQVAVIKELEHDGHDTVMAHRVLTALRDSRQALVDHRALIIEQIARLSSGHSALAGTYADLDHEQLTHHH